MPRVGLGRVTLDAVQSFLAVESSHGVEQAIDDGDSHPDPSSAHLRDGRPSVLGRLVSTGCETREI